MIAPRSLVDAAQVRALLREQFPEWSDLPVQPVDPQGWDNASFRLGERLVARFPTDAAYASQVEREQRWLPWLAPQLPLPIPRPAAMGRPGAGYAWNWSVHHWLEGVAASHCRVLDDVPIASELARFLRVLQGIDCAGAPVPGEENFHRGGDLAAYDAQARRALATLGDRVDSRAAAALWDKALATTWRAPPVWVHGDVSPSNLLVESNRLAAVIDFGNLCAGDPACDLSIAWTWLSEEARRTYRSELGLDDDTWVRARAWALWKAAIVAAGIATTNAPEYAKPLEILERCLRPERT